MIWRVRHRCIDLSHRGCIMGILNTTPDSFSDGGQHQEPDAALTHARRMIEEGADIIDIGGESTRPGAPAVSAEVELQRVIPVIRALRAEWDGFISIDTSKAVVAAAALEAGADIVNDVTGLRGDADMVEVCRKFQPGLVIMHMQGTPSTMQQCPTYDDVVTEVRDFFEQRLNELTAAGIERETLCFDPGIGFGKTAEHNWLLIQRLQELRLEDRPLLLGVSRKSFIGARLDSQQLEDRHWPTVALTALVRERGAVIHRVHAVRENRDALRMTEALLHEMPH